MFDTVFGRLVKEDPNLEEAIEGNPITLRDIERLTQGRVKEAIIKNLIKALGGKGFTEEGRGPSHRYIFNKSATATLVAEIQKRINT